jgi:hypothetical protein
MTYLDTDRNGVITYATELLHFFIPYVFAQRVFRSQPRQPVIPSQINSPDE